jgi:hypothetical protein
MFALACGAQQLPNTEGDFIAKESRLVSRRMDGEKSHAVLAFFPGQHPYVCRGADSIVGPGQGDARGIHHELLN